MRLAATINTLVIFLVVMVSTYEVLVSNIQYISHCGVNESMNDVFFSPGQGKSITMCTNVGKEKRAVFVPKK